MAPRANWKGVLQIAELHCPVALYAAVSGSENIRLHVLNRQTGHRVHRIMVDRETGEPVEPAAQVKGYEVAENEFIAFSSEEIAAAVPESTKLMAIEAFVDCTEVDDIYFDRPYYLAPSEAAALEAFSILREGMRRSKVAALARAVLFRRLRTMLIRPYDGGLIGTTLKFDYEVRADSVAFSDIPRMEIGKEAQDLARHIVETKRGSFDPRAVEDRYEQALAELVRARRAGESPELPVPPRESGNVVDLMEALRRSAGGNESRKSRQRTGSSHTPGTRARRKAG